MKRLLFIFAALNLSTSVYAHNGNDGWVTVNNYMLWSNTNTYPQIRISIVGDTIYNPAGCSDADSYMVSTALSEAIQNRIYSTLLAALMAQKPIVLRIETANGSCELTRPKILNVRMQN